MEEFMKRVLVVVWLTLLTTSIVFSQDDGRLQRLQEMTTQVPDSVPLYNLEISKIVYFPLKWDLERMNGIMGKPHDVYSINSGGVYPDDCTYRWNMNGGFYIFGVSKKGFLNFIYFRYITDYTIPEFDKLPWSKDYLYSKAGEPNNSYGDENLQLLWYDNKVLKWYRFDLDKKDNLIKGFQIICPAWEKIIK